MPLLPRKTSAIANLKKHLIALCHSDFSSRIGRCRFARAPTSARAPRRPPSPGRIRENKENRPSFILNGNRRPFMLSKGCHSAGLLSKKSGQARPACGPAISWK
ncbi:hypothetical protein EVAR_59438_1 [Eumeta japonica]|uniref:Uncharacterized protein n=1 Tax=Eumeta variegata TaxID=151549 RepID=A0A4C1YYQ9_EUMVA|nr:hypothetical protein EVAR_59438_1 [Eumeta japonica]